MLNLTMSGECLNQLALNKLRGGDVGGAIELWGQFVELFPDNAAAVNNLGAAHLELGRQADAVQCFAKAMALDPSLMEARSALIMAMLMSDQHDAEDVEAHQEAMTERIAELVKPFTSHDNDRDPAKRLKIGYVSHDLRANHAVLRFMQTLLANHTDDVEVFVYHTGRPDQYTMQMIVGAAVGEWRDCEGESDDDLAAEIRHDGIDVLVDLNMHTHGGRPLLFARKPAPVQISYLAYPGDSGLSAIDYFLTDARIGGDCLMLDSYWCYAPPDEAPEVGPLPRDANGYVTFGCLNNFQKVTPSCLSAWRRIMSMLPDSRLILYCPEGAHRAGVIESLDVDASRVEFVGKQSMAAYFATYNRIDVALDTFPYAGGTTTCDALWMGVPIVTTGGEKPTNRSGSSILEAVGFLPPSDVTENYPLLAVHMGTRDLGAYRNLMRTCMLGSKLMDAPRHARSVEAAYRTAWNSYCKGSK